MGDLDENGSSKAFSRWRDLDHPAGEGLPLHEGRGEGHLGERLVPGTLLNFSSLADDLVGKIPVFCCLDLAVSC